MADMNELHHGHIVVGLRAEASNGDSTCSQLAEDAADYIELLEYYLRCESTWQPYSQKLEAALREIAWIATPDHEEARHKATEIARKALEGKDD
jgi:hypothetical protein